MGFDFGNFRFEPGNLDLPSGGIGFAAGVGASYVYYRVWRYLQDLRADSSPTVRRGATYAMRAANRRYLNDMIKLCQTSHMVGSQINLTDIVVEPRFIRAPETVEMPDEDDERPIFSLVPQVHDLPELHAPYNIETISLEDLGEGDRAIALLGLPGSGRTTALMSMALWSTGVLEFSQDADIMQQRFEEEENSLPDKERAERIKARFNIEQRAMEFAEGTGKGDDGENSSDPVFRQLIPMYVHLGNMTLGRREYGRNVDPAEPLVRALQSHLSYVSAKTTPGDLYDYLSEGVALVLLDGMDELPEEDQRRKVAWLQAFIEDYGRNFIVAAHTPQGAHALNRAGLTSVYLRPWYDQNAHQLLNRWSENWKTISGQRRAEVGSITKQRVKAYSRNQTPFEYTLRLWSELEAGDTIEETGKDSSQLVNDYLIRIASVDEEELTELSQMAAIQLDEGFITLERLVELHMGLAANTLVVEDEDEAEVTSDAGTVDDFEALLESDDDDEDFGELFDDDDEPAVSRSNDDEDEEEDKSRKKAAKPEANLDKEQAKQYREISREQAKWLKRMVKSGLLVQFRKRRYQFRHIMLTHYLGSQFLLAVDEETLVEKSLNPRWDTAIGFASRERDIESAVKIRLDAPSDLLYNNVLQPVRWLAYAARSAGVWRGHLLKALGNLLVAPNQYQLIRERVAAALVHTKDSTAAKVFRRALESPINDVRRLACLGAGALQDEESIEQLKNLLDDSNVDVRIAAALGLGAIGTQKALIAIAEEMTISETQDVRRAIAESLAIMPEDGYPTLYDAVQSDEIQLRRAAVFGLGRVTKSWAVHEVYKVFLDDPEWYVQTAAQTVFAKMTNKQQIVPKKYPAVGAMPWMIQWALNPENEVPNNIGGIELLRYALQHDDPQVQQLAVATVGQLGLTEMVGEAYAELGHQEETIRDTAYRALADLQLQSNSPLPAPVS